MATSTVKADSKSNLIYTIELTNWVVFRSFVKQLETIFASEKGNGRAVILEVWSFPDKRKQQPNEAGTEIKG